ncbi:membrane protein [Bacillus thuringiensis]|nr:membrane protein [Bacillus thuringiensis]
MKTYIQALKWATGIYHLLLIPFCYLFLNHANLYGIPLLVIALHITTILLSKKASMNTYPHYIGIIVTLVAFFPYIDVVLHMIASIFLLLDAASINAKKVYDS